jgi:hypothetical protein
MKEGNSLTQRRKGTKLKIIKKFFTTKAPRTQRKDSMYLKNYALCELCAFVVIFSI